MIARFALGVIATAGVLCHPALQAQDGADCSSCHEQGQKLTASAHASLGCKGCHAEHESFPHPERVPKPSCASCHPSQSQDWAKSVHGAAAKAGKAAPDCAVCHDDVHATPKTSTLEFRRNSVVTCGACHQEPKEQFDASVHAKAVAEGNIRSAVCTDCHGEHAIVSPRDKTSLVNPRRLRDTCGTCHGDLRLTSRFGLPADRLTSFDSSFHGLAARAGSQTVANCASCHKYHDILPSTDPKSSVHPQNLANTCSQCHPGAGKRFALGPIHVSEGGKEPAGVVWVRNFYLLAIPLTIGLMILHHGGDWIRKLYALRLTLRGPGRSAIEAARVAARPTAAQFRMHRSERILHALLALSFFVLVWTGFALKYPDQWWARMLVRWESSFPLRGWVHRGAGVVMILVAVAHVVALAVNPGLRHHWRHLLPNRNDIRDGFQGLAYNLGLIGKPPPARHHGYAEKVEYWAVVWGTAVMAMTGVFLWANNFALAYFPKSWLDVAVTLHFYEAVLATLAIVVWHLYSVIYDPEVYPMDPAWLTGWSIRRRPIEDDPPTGNSPKSSG